MSDNLEEILKKIESNEINYLDGVNQVLNSNNTKANKNKDNKNKDNKMDKNEWIKAYIKKQFIEELKLSADDMMDDTRFEDLGIDSISIMSVTEKLEDIFGSLPKTLFFEYVNLNELSVYLNDNYSNIIDDIMNKDEGVVLDIDVFEENKTIKEKKIKTPLIDEKVLSNTEDIYKKTLSANNRYLGEHKILNKIMLPAVAYLELAIEAGMLLTNKKVKELKDFVWKVPFVLDKPEKDIFITLIKEVEYVSFKIYFEENNERVICAEGKLIVGNISNEVFNKFDINELYNKCTERVQEKVFFNRFDNLGYEYGSYYRTSKDIYYNSDEAVSYNVDYNADENEGMIIPPNILDTCFRSTFCIDGEILKDNFGTKIPFYLESFKIKGDFNGNCYSYGNVPKNFPRGKDTIKCNMVIINEFGEEIIEISELVSRQYKNMEKSVDKEIRENVEIKESIEVKSNIEIEEAKSEKIDNRVAIIGISNNLCTSDKFDEKFFDIEKEKLEKMTISEKILMQTVWEVMEDAGYSEESLDSRKIGVFIGADYIEKKDIEGYACAANKVSYNMKFNGPSVTIDTTVSTSLEAIRIGFLNIISKECDMALVGEIKGEKVAVSLLKPLKEATYDNDNIYKVINNISADYGESPENLIKKNSIDTESVSFLENGEGINEINQSLLEIKDNDIQGNVEITCSGITGSNVYIQLEEIEERNSINKEEEKESVIVLSAKSEEKLKEYAKSLAEFIEKNNDKEKLDMSIANIAYTLQLGRVPMNNRLAIISANTTELLEKLNKFIEGNNQECYVGSVLERLDEFDIFNDEDGQEFIDSLIKKKRFNKIAKLWTRGINIEWSSIYSENKPQKISLPTYPFYK